MYIIDTSKQKLTGDKKMTSQEILEIIESTNAQVFGFRAIENKYALSIGDDVPNSYDWDFENDCSSDDFLPGASAIYICEFPEIIDIENTIKKMKTYNQDNTQLLLIAGNHAGHGDDKDEILIADATVLAIL